MRLLSMLRWQLLVTLAAVAPAPVLHAQNRPPVTERDSAGIRIVENRAAARPAGRGWRLSPEPLLQIGTVFGDTTLELSNTSAAIRLSDGRIVVAQSNHLKVFDAAGRFVQQIGRRGGGPGEFNAWRLLLTRLPNDAIGVFGEYDPLIFDSKGEFVGTVPVPVTRLGIAANFQLRGRNLMHDASVIVAVGERSQRRPPGVFSDRRYYVRYIPGSTGVDTLGFYRDRRLQVRTLENGRLTHDIIPFTWGTLHGWGADRFYVGDPDRYEIHAFEIPARGTTGPRRAPMRPAMIIRLVRPPRPVSMADRRAWAEERRARTPEGLLPELERHLAEIEWPAAHPEFSDMKADAQGNLWVGELRPPAVATKLGMAGRPLPTFYSVFERTGRYLGEVPVPPDVEILEIGSDYVIGVWKDAEDVEFVRVYSLSKR